MWEALKKIVSNPTVQGVIVAAAVALLESIVGDSDARSSSDSQ